jgi:hypothetical protein
LDAEVDLPHLGTSMQGKVKRRARDGEGELFGKIERKSIVIQGCTKLNAQMYQCRVCCKRDCREHVCSV